ncbi:MAG TPA: hypothetical protein VJJ78_02055 [Candidatus Saccharimonadales bacterium]|nr:MAG: hypothetical protein A3D14_01475 [Candidatus Saccharibacteria bacterium RIFCSPHIGHO2_02_FULL_47_12]HLB66357.1 hypothetical protein [Candidatus Saccharimonadales bacterium]
MSYELRSGNNTDITVVGNSVYKVSRYAFLQEDATEMAKQLESYAETFESEPIDVPDLKEVGIIKKSGDRYRVIHVLDLCTDPNLCSLQEEDLRSGLQRVLGQIAAMSTFDNERLLRVPIDASANNFHVGHKGVLVDLFPPLLRKKDGSLPFSNIQYSRTFIRRNLISYTRGTVEGAILSTLFTGIMGDRPFQQAIHTAKGIDTWCYDMIPTTLKAPTKDNIRRQIKAHFIPHFLRNSISDGICGVQKMLGVSPYGRGES